MDIMLQFWHISHLFLTYHTGLKERETRAILSVNALCEKNKNKTKTNPEAQEGHKISGILHNCILNFFPSYDYLNEILSQA